MRLGKTNLKILLLGFSCCLAACGSGGNNGNNGNNGNQGLQNLAFSNLATMPAGPVPAKAQALFIGDFTADQKPDFAVLNDTIGVFVGNGDGNFQPVQNATSLVTMPSALTAGEFALTNIDLVASFPSTNQVDLYFDPDQNASYADNAPYNGGTSPEGVAVGDFNGDWKDDIALSNTDGNLTVKINTGAATFNDFLFSAPGKLSNPRNLIAGDFNGDHHVDLAFANFGGDSLTVWLNSGDANPAFLFEGSNADDSLALPAGSGVQGLWASDLDEDGDLDLAAANPNTKNLSVFLNVGNASFGPPSLYPAGSDAFAVASADFNLDGIPDLLVVNAFGTDGVHGDFCVYLGNGDGSFADPQTFSAGVDAANQANHPRSVAVADFNGDGKPDLVTSNSPGDSVTVTLNTSH